MKKLFTSVILSLLTLSVTTVPVYAQTDWAASGRSGEQACVKSYDGGTADVATIRGIECLVANILATVMTIIGIAAFVMFLIGSFRWLTAGTNTKGVESGKNAITFAIIGIVVALASFVILRFIESFTGITLINFRVGLPTQ